MADFDGETVPAIPLALTESPSRPLTPDSQLSKTEKLVKSPERREAPQTADRQIELSPESKVPKIISPSSRSRLGTSLLDKPSSPSLVKSLKSSKSSETAEPSLVRKSASPKKSPEKLLSPSKSDVKLLEKSVETEPITELRPKPTPSRSPHREKFTPQTPQKIAPSSPIRKSLSSSRSPIIEDEEDFEDEGEEVEVPEEILNQPIQLNADQLGQVEKLKAVLISSPGYIDTSSTGRGKTFITLAVAQHYEFDIVIICPVSVANYWRKLAEKFGVKIHFIFSYQKLSGRKFMDNISNPLLNRIDTMHESSNLRQTVITSFEPTEQYFQLLNFGFLLIVDEIQNVKKNCATHKAVRALIKPIATQGSRCRFALLSASPIDADDQIINLLRLMGYIEKEKLYYVHRTTHQIVLDGLDSLISFCHQYNPTKTKQIMQTKLTKDSIPKICRSLYMEVIKPEIVFGLPKKTVFENGARIFVFNGFFNIHPDYKPKLKNAIAELITVSSYNEKDRTAYIPRLIPGAKTKKGPLDRMREALQMVEKCKVFDMAQRAVDNLLVDPNRKIILCFNYKASVFAAESSLIDFHPLVITGDDKAEIRGEIIEKFNLPTNEYRLLIMTVKTGGVGINLHDTDGRFPRIMFVSPSYSFQEMYQVAGRIAREGLASNAYLYMFYGNSKELLVEKNIIQALAKKSKAAREAIADDSAIGNLYPGDYPEWHEPEGLYEKMLG